jgi:hypothetical protein
MTDYYQDYEEWCRQYDKKDVPPPQKTWRDSFRETCDTLKAGLAATAICVVFLGGVVWLMTLIPEPEPFQTKAACERALHSYQHRHFYDDNPMLWSAYCAEMERGGWLAFIGGETDRVFDLKGVEQ